MKLLLIGANSSYAIERFYLNHLRKCINEVELFEAQNIFLEYYNKHIINKITFRLGLSAIYRKINKMLLREVDIFKPDCVLVFKGMELFPSTIVKLKNKGIIVTNYNPDHPFIIKERGTGNSNVTKSVGLYDTHFCYNRMLMDEIEQRYQIPTVFLPFGFEPTTERISVPEEKEEILAIGFIGTADRVRAETIKVLLNNNLPVEVYGNQWDRYFKKEKYPNLRILPPVYNQEFWNTARKYRVQLNIFRPHNEGSHNMRTFEMPAAGTIMLAPDSPEHRMFFEHGQEAFFYKDVSDMVTKAKQILAMTTEESNQIRYNARKRSIENDYTYENRAGTVFQELNKLMLLKSKKKSVLGV